MLAEAKDFCFFLEDFFADLRVLVSVAVVMALTSKY